MMYEFKQPDAWISIDDFLAMPAGTTCDQELDAAGYYSRPMLFLGDEEDDQLSISLYSRNPSFPTPKGAQYRFLVLLCVGTDSDYIALHDMPDLMAFLRIYGPLVMGVDEWYRRRYPLDGGRPCGAERRCCTPPLE